MNSIVEFVKKHPQSTVTFDYDADFDQYAVKVRDFELNKAWTQKFNGVDFENSFERIVKYALKMAEKEVYRTDQIGILYDEM